jgi:hypothetical protein
MKLSKALRAILWGQPFGDVWPKRDVPRPPLYDGRTAALRILRRYFSELVFYRPGGRDLEGRQKDPIAFQVPDRDIHVEWPDDEPNLRSPSIVFLSQQAADYDAIGMTSRVDETWPDKTHLLTWMSEYDEDFAIEIWAETKQQRRALILGIEQALSPLEYMAGIRFVMPEYYGQLCCFSLQSREVIDDEQATVLRRKARMIVKLRFNVCALYPATIMRPDVKIEVDADEDTGGPLVSAGELPEAPEEERKPGSG